MQNINDFNSEAEYYDLFEKKNQLLFDKIIDFLVKIFKENNVKKILDFTCGTGAQTIPLSQKGFDVVGIDIAEKLLEIAKAKNEGVSDAKFYKGDVRNSRFGKFDAVISMLNSLGYLSKSDFSKALVNINNNLKLGGLFVFDNTNKDCLDAGNFITDKMIDAAGENNGIKFVRFAESNYDSKNGVITTKWSSAVQKGSTSPIKRAGVWKRQTYSNSEIEEIFNKAGFRLEQIYDRTLDRFDLKNSFSYLIIGRKVK